MSFGKNSENSYFYSLYEEEQKKELNNLWEYFMTSFNYNTYYHLSINNNKSDSNNFLSNNNNNILNSENYIKSIAIKKLNKFFKKNKINILNNFNLSSNIFTSILLLSEAKLWIMYLILSNYKDNYYDINKNLILFNFALKKNCDSISLFEFFLINFSQINPDAYIQQIKNINKNNIPQEFIKIFKNNKKILYEIFNINDKENIIDDIYTIPTSTLFNKFNNNNNDFNNKFEEENSFSFGIKNNNNNNINNDLEDLEIESLNFSENEEFIFKDNENLNNFNINFLNSEPKNNNFNFKIIDDKYLNPNKNEEEFLIENEDLTIIIKDYLSKGFFAIAQKNNKNKNKFIIIPLKEKFNYEEKLNVIELLNELNKSKYSNFEYYPFQNDCVEKIKNGKICYEII